jgi:rhodanese-related sulfurtransferase
MAGTGKCSAQDLRKRLEEGAGVLVDVREYPEYVEAHIRGSRLVPLSDLKKNPEALPEDAEGREILLLCGTGRRAEEAAAILRAQGRTRLVVVDGGMEAWKQAGCPTQRVKGPMSLERQVRIAAGALVLTGLLVPGLTPLAFFVGAGLIFAGITNSCAMGMLLAKLPWNRARQPRTDAPVPTPGTR